MNSALISVHPLIALVLTASLLDQEKPSPPVVQPPVTPNVSGRDTRELPRTQPWKPGDPVRQVPDLRRTNAAGSATPQVLAVDLRAVPPTAAWPAGQSAHAVAAGSYIIDVLRGGFAVRSKSVERLAGPFTFESLWRDSPACGRSGGEPLNAAYDRAAGRWLLGRWAAPSPDSTFHYCFALSRTKDPAAGGWYLYDFALPMYRAGTSIKAGPKSYSIAIEDGTRFVFDRNELLAGRPVEPQRIGKRR